jgi:peptide/nickel transport system substrate-binding protein
MAGAACSSSKPRSSTASNTAAGSANQANTDATATLGFINGSAAGVSYNIHTYGGGLSSWTLFTTIYDRLIQLTGNSQGLAPMLATAWKWNSTDTQLTFTLRQGVVFQDGSAFNADVAVANIKAGSATGSNGQTMLATMTSAVATGPSTVVLTSASPTPAPSSPSPATPA